MDDFEKRDERDGRDWRWEMRGTSQHKNSSGRKKINNKGSLKLKYMWW